MNPCCIRVSKFGDSWSAATVQVPGDPIDLAELVMQSPEFLGMLEPSKPMPRAAMVAPQSSSGCVLVAVDETGIVSLVGCPDFKAEGGAGAVISDLLAANGRLWHQKPDVLTAPFQEFHGTSLSDWVAARVGRNWSAAAFMTGVEKCLSQGKFAITIVVAKLDDPARELLGYLKNMNLVVRVLGYDLYRGDGVEVIRPRLLAEPQPEVPKPEPEVKTTARAEKRQPEPVKLGQPRTAFFGAEVQPSTFTSPPAQTTAASAQPTATGRGPDAGPFPDEGASPKQKEVLVRLLGLDSIGLRRKGLEYFLPTRAGEKDPGSGTIVIAYDPDRWPFPKKDEVIVVIYTGRDQLAGYLKIAPNEIEDFLGSLPRVERKEHKDCLLLRAATPHEATQLVNEVRALKAVSFGSFS